MHNSTQSDPEPSSQVPDFLVNALLEASSDPILIFDSHWRLRQHNPAAATVFDLTGESIGQPIDVVVQAKELVTFARDSQPLPEWSPARAAAEFTTFEPRIQMIRAADESADGWVLMLRDVTQVKKLNRSQYEFIRIVSHDLRSPLTFMQGYGSMLESGGTGTLNEKQTEFVKKILAGITQMTALVDNIQDAGRFDPETGFYEMQRSACDVGDMVVRIVRSHLIPAEKQELKISVSVADDVPIINVDANMLERAITNLVDNAVKYTPNGGKVDVSVRCVQKELQIAVRDTGLGISPENQKRLFRRHVRIPRQEHKKIKGTGLGLFIIRSVARQHDGDAWVESIEGEGSTFTMRIPLKGDNLHSSAADD